MADAELFHKIIDTGAALTIARQDQGAIPYVVVPKDYKLESLEPLLVNPVRVTQSVRVYEAASFAEYFLRYRNQASRIFVDTKYPRIIGVIDYHRHPVDAKFVDTGNPTPVIVSAERTTHRVTLEFRKTADWLGWIGNNGRLLSQVDMAQFIEDNVHNITKPDGAYMFDVACSIEAKKDVEYRSAVRLDNGQTQLTYNEEIKGTAQQGNIEIPNTFFITVAPFEGSKEYEIPVRFRYSLSGSKLQLKYDIVRPDKAIEKAVTSMTDQVRTLIGDAAPITIGVPE